MKTIILSTLVFLILIVFACNSNRQKEAEQSQANVIATKQSQAM